MKLPIKNTNTKANKTEGEIKCLWCPYEVHYNAIGAMIHGALISSNTVTQILEIWAPLTRKSRFFHRRHHCPSAVTWIVWPKTPLVDRVIKGPDPFLGWFYSGGFFCRACVLVWYGNPGQLASLVLVAAILIMFVNNSILLRVHRRVVRDAVGRDILLPWGRHRLVNGFYNLSYFPGFPIRRVFSEISHERADCS